MKIRDKLLLGFSLYILTAIIFVFFSYKEIRAITMRFSYVEVVDDINNEVLEVRRSEKNFFLFTNEESLKEMQEYLNALKKNIDGIKGEIIKAIESDNYIALNKAITEYGYYVNNLTNNFTSQENLIVMIRAAGNQIAKSLSGKELDEFLILRRYEQNIMLYKDQKVYDVFKSFKPLNLEGNKEIEKYRMLVHNHYEIYQYEKDLEDEMRSKAKEIQNLTEKLSTKEREYISLTLKMVAKLATFGLFIMIVLGTVITIQLSRNIADPIKRLEEITKKIAMGDFSETIEAKGKDEIASLGMSFNQMKEKILFAKSILENAVAEAVGKLGEKQAQLIATEKLAILGLFAAGVAHEINNPLAIINEKAGLMKDIIEMSEDFKHKTRFLKLLDAIFESINRCRTVTHRILGFARKTEVSIEILNLNDIIKNVTVFLEKEILYKNIRLDLNLKENLPEVRSDKGQLQQVFLNIIKNAIDAVENGGLVVVSTDIKDENMVKVSIKDNGHGISGEDLKHIFEPFFTTKGKGKGTGLGLSITNGIVKNLGGNIFLESEGGKGTTFMVEIPTNPELTKGQVA
jgi:signal transduction histidine kinase